MQTEFRAEAIVGAQFRQRVTERSFSVGVVGLGYVGLPLAAAFAKAGFVVAGVDVAETRVAAIMAGRSPIIDVSSQTISDAVSARRLTATTEYAPLATADAIFICVPTPFDRAKAPDLRFVIAAAEGVASILRKDHVVILESTTYPGTTEEVLLPILERSGLKAGRDFRLAFSPERIDPGNRRFDIQNTPKIVGGIDNASAAAAALVLAQVIENGAVHVVSSTRAAELTKLLENTFRAVNIALVNELAMLCDRMGIDVWEVIEAASTKPYGFMPFYPGPGVGGHCIPVDPYYLSWKAREFDFSTKFIELAAETNQGMALFTVAKLRRLMRERGLALERCNLLVLGAAFKPNVDDSRHSPAIRVMEILASEGAHVTYHDPYVPNVILTTGFYAAGAGEQRLASVPLCDEAIREADCVVILVSHSNVDYEAVVRHARLVFDAVHATRGVRRNRVAGGEVLLL